MYSYGLLFHQIVPLEKRHNDISDDDHEANYLTRRNGCYFTVGARTISMRPSMNIGCQVLIEERVDIVRFGSPSVSMSSLSLSTPPPSSSMSYVASCSFLSFSDYNVVFSDDEEEHYISQHQYQNEQQQ